MLLMLLDFLRQTSHLFYSSHEAKRPNTVVVLSIGAHEHLTPLPSMSRRDFGILSMNELFWKSSSSIRIRRVHAVPHPHP